MAAAADRAPSGVGYVLNAIEMPAFTEAILANRHTGNVLAGTIPMEKSHLLKRGRGKAGRKNIKATKTIALNKKITRRNRSKAKKIHLL